MDKAYSVKHTSDGGYIVAGRTGSYGSGNADIFLMKLDSGGNVVWARAYDITSDGGFVVGYSIIVKTNSSGDVEWYRVLGGTRMDAFYSVDQTSDGGFIATGITKSFGSDTIGDVFFSGVRLTVDHNGTTPPLYNRHPTVGMLCWEEPDLSLREILISSLLKRMLWVILGPAE